MWSPLLSQWKLFNRKQRVLWPNISRWLSFLRCQRQRWQRQRGQQLWPDMAEGARWNSLNSLGVESIAPRTGSYSTTHVLRCLCSVFSANQLPLLLRMGQLDKSQMIWAIHMYLEYFPPLLHEDMSFQFFDFEKKLLSTSRSSRMYKFCFKKISLISVLSKNSHLIFVIFILLQAPVEKLQKRSIICQQRYPGSQAHSRSHDLAVVLGSDSTSSVLWWPQLPVLAISLGLPLLHVVLWKPDPRSFLLIPAGSPVRPTHSGAIPKERKLAGERKELLMSWIQISGNFSSKREIDRRGRDGVFLLFWGYFWAFFWLF